MAEPALPYHKPHTQLRTEAPKQKSHSDKYVSAFVGGESTVDMSFKNPILEKSSDHFKVGIDELTVNLNRLSMLEYDVTDGDVVFKIIRRGVGDATVSTFDPLTPAGLAAGAQVWRDAFTFRADRPYTNMLEVVDRFNQIANAVGTFIRAYGLINPQINGQQVNLWGGARNLGAGTAANHYLAGSEYRHCMISITCNGQIRFSGNIVFWANFAIRVPNEKYRQILFKSPYTEFVSIHPYTGDSIPNPFIYVGEDLQSQPLDPVWDGNVGGDPEQADATAHEFVGEGNLLNTLDRRVTLEVGCSLPLKNSPMVDHGQEAPDFVLGRYMFHQPYTIENRVDNPVPIIAVPGLGTRTMQGPKDRICYHHLQAQQKIQVLRLKLWARVRDYNETTKQWGMRTIVCPVDDIDYWHVRLHFLEK